MPPPTPSTAGSSQCGFHGPDGTVVLEDDLRKAIVVAANAERTAWFDPSSKALQKEGDDARFGDLVRYWLAGAHTTIRPGKLEAAQQAALDPTVTYTNLTNSALNAAIRKLAAAEVTFEAALADRYAKWAAADLAKPQVAAAQAAASAAARDHKAARQRLNDARRRAGTSTASQAAIRTAAADFAAAKSAHEAALRKLDTAQDPERALPAARRNYLAARSKSDALRNRAANWEVPGKSAIRKDILKATTSTDPQKIDSLVEAAVQLAHQSRADKEPWSAVFVSACVRAAAIRTGLEAIDSTGAHRGRNMLLEVSQKHAVYVVRARAREKARQPGTYHAFEPTLRVVTIADIICTDRRNFIEQPKKLPDVASGDILHGDIVTRIERVNGKPVYAEAVGGNVGQTVRRRRYPLDAAGRLTVAKGVLFVHENDDGTFPPLATVSTVPTRLDRSSTARILALLSLVDECKPKAARSTRKDAEADSEENSPFMDAEILRQQPGSDCGPRAAALAAESPFTHGLAVPISPPCPGPERRPPCVAPYRLTAVRSM